MHIKMYTYAYTQCLTLRVLIEFSEVWRLITVITVLYSITHTTSKQSDFLCQACVCVCVFNFVFYLSDYLLMD